MKHASNNKGSMAFGIITIALLVLVGDMYDNRQMYVDKANINRTADTILGMHSVNLIPEEIIREEEGG